MSKKISYIERSPVNIHQKIDRNATTYFLKPIISDDNTSLTMLTTAEFIHNGLINFYLGWKDSGYYRHQDCMYILMNPSIFKLKEWVTFYNKYKAHKNYVDTIFLDYCIILLVFRIESKYRMFPKLLLNGKFSHFGLSYAEKFFMNRELTNGKIRLIPTEQYFIITKNAGYKAKLEEKIGMILDDNMELWSVPDIENEILDWQKIVKNYYGR